MTDPEKIELEIKKAVDAQMVAFRQTVESHHAFLEKSATKLAWFAGIGLTAFGILFAYLFQRSIKETVGTLDVVGEARNSLSNKMASFNDRLALESSNRLITLQTSLLKEADPRLRRSVDDLISKQTGQERLSAAVNEHIAQIKQLSPTQIVEQALAVPPGTVVAYGGDIDVATGWLKCDGGEEYRTNYPRLAKAIGNTWGAASTPEKFKLPDLRGLFLRGVDGPAGRDPDTSNRTNLVPDRRW